MNEQEWLAERFEAERPHLRAVAYRMLGSLNEADDAVQEAWLRLSRSDADEIDNLGGWLTTVVARISLNTLRSRRARPEAAMTPHVPDPIVGPESGLDPEHEALVADSVGLALLVVLEQLDPAERLAFVLHDMFAVPFDDIAEMVGRSPAAARQLASRARRRVQGRPVPDPDLDRQREVVDAFFAASRDGDFEALVAILDPEVVFRIDVGGHGPLAREPVTGAEAVARQVLARGRPFARFALPARVNGRAGVIVAPGGTPLAVVGFTTGSRRILAIDLITDPDKLRRIVPTSTGT